MLTPWHQYAHEVVAAGLAEAAIQDRLRPMLLRARTLAKGADNEAQIAALERKAAPLKAELTALPLRVGRLAMLACQRHLRDLETGAERGLYFNEKTASAAVRFYSFLTHNKGEWAGKPITLEPWQQFIIASLFGWKRANGTRRFRESYLEVARKNGKSTFSSGVGLQLLTADNEAGAEVYCAATKKEQARIVFGDAQNMARKSPALANIIKVQQHAIFSVATSSKMVPMSADAITEDGLNPHGIIIDEYHAHPNDALYGVLKSATGARSQPLLSIITTAGFNRVSACAQLRRACVGLLDGLHTDDAYFVMIHTLDDADDWQDESVWQKANPNLNVSLSLEYLREQYRAAVRLVSQQVTFKTKHLNLWTDSSAVWIPHDKWMQGAIGTPPELLTGRPCWGGLDLAKSRDISALVLIFPKEEEAFDVLCWFWVPEDKMVDRTQNDGVPYQQWVDEGYLIATPGNVTDYNFIKSEVRRLCLEYQVQMIQYDQYNASQLVIDLMSEGVPMLPMRQGYVTLSPPTVALENLAEEAKIHHYGNPVLSWMCGNIELERDAAGNIKISKRRSRDKIDGMAALINALEGKLFGKPGDSGYIYEDRPILELGG